MDKVKNQKKEIMTNQIIKDRGLKLQYVADQLGVSRDTLRRRLINNNWKKGEIVILKQMQLWKQ